MRINFTLAAMVLGITITCLSCSKTSQEEMVLTTSAPRTIDEMSATLTTEGIYELSLTSEKVEIHKQASHFEHSVIGVDEKSGMFKYKYVPAKGFTGSDEVTLSETRYLSTPGAGCNYDGSMEMDSRGYKSTTFTRIKFVVK